MTYSPQQPPTVPGYSAQPPQGDWTPPRAKSRVVPWLIGALAVTLLAAAALSFALLRRNSHDNPTPARPAARASTAAATTSFQLYGTLTLKGGQFITVNDTSCRGYEGFDDLNLGASVTVTDAAGAVIGVGQINSLVYNEDELGGGTCELNFSMPSVPAGKGFYGIEVSHRGSVKFDEAELKAGRADLTVG